MEQLILIFWAWFIRVYRIFRTGRSIDSECSSVLINKTRRNGVHRNAQCLLVDGSSTGVRTELDITPSL